MSTGKDSPEAVVFMAKFKELKNWSDDTPDELIELAVKDVSVKDLCVQVDFAAVAFKQDELRSPEPFVAPVSPAFQKAWRDYEKTVRACRGPNYPHGLIRGTWRANFPRYFIY